MTDEKVESVLEIGLRLGDGYTDENEDDDESMVLVEITDEVAESSGTSRPRTPSPPEDPVAELAMELIAKLTADVVDATVTTVD